MTRMDLVMLCVVILCALATVMYLMVAVAEKHINKKR